MGFEAPLTEIEIHSINGEKTPLQTVAENPEELQFGFFPIRDWTTSQRNRMLISISFIALLCPFTNCLFLPALTQITYEFDAKPYEISLAASVVLLPMAVLPLFWGPLSELYGRRYIYLGIAVSMIIIFYLSAWSWAIWPLIIWRFVSGVPFAALDTLGYGVISDVYAPPDRAKAAGIMQSFPLAAPIVGPIIGGLFAFYGSWRYSFLLQAVLSTFAFFMLLINLPETFNFKLKRRFNITRSVVVMFQDPRILTLAFLSGIELGQTSLMNIVITTSTAQTLQLNSVIAGAILLPMGIANVVGVLVGGKLADLGLRRKGLGGRLTTTIIGTTCMMFFNIGFGFTCQVAWYYPAFFSFGAALCRTIGVAGIMTYCIERMPTKASSVIAGINSTNYVWNFSVLFISPIMASAMGGGVYSYGPVFIVLCGIQAVLLCITIVIRHYSLGEGK